MSLHPTDAHIFLNATKRMAKKQIRAASGSARNLETQAAIFSAAAAVLQEHGYGGFSIDAVARRCGAGRPTIYRWWPNKAALLVEVYIGQSISITRPAPNTGSVRGDLIQHSKVVALLDRNPVRPRLPRLGGGIAGRSRGAGSAQGPGSSAGALSGGDGAAARH